MPRRELSRQRRWQLARIAEGRCSQCGKPRRHYAAVCDECALIQRRRNRAHQGCKAWKPGGMGRPPVVAERSRRRPKPGSSRQSPVSRSAGSGEEQRGRRS